MFSILLSSTLTLIPSSCLEDWKPKVLFNNIYYVYSLDTNSIYYYCIIEHKGMNSTKIK
jgi:hypothetical protein